MAIREVGALLAVVMHNAAIDFHASLLASMTNRGSGNKTLYIPGRGGSDEDEWATEIKRHHMGGKPSWTNSNASMWSSEAGFFEVMKLFCAPMGKHKQAIKKARAADVDFSSLTAMLLICDKFEAGTVPAEKQQKNLIRAAAAARNPWAYNQRLEFTKDEREKHLDSL
jgi:hypothetical protein